MPNVFGNLRPTNLQALALSSFVFCSLRRDVAAAEQGSPSNPKLPIIPREVLQQRERTSGTLSAEQFDHYFSQNRHQLLLFDSAPFAF